MDISSLVRIGFTLPTATDLSDFFANCAYIADYDTDDLVDGATVSENGTNIGSVEALNSILKADTQYYKDIEAILTQKGNANPNMAEVKYVILFQKKSTDVDWGACLTRMISVNANFSQVSMSSREDNDVASIGAVCAIVNRLGEFNVCSADVSGKVTGNVALTLASANNANVKLSYDSDNQSPLAQSIMAIQAGGKLGKQGDLYSSLTNVTPKTYTDTIEGNLNDQKVSFYSYVNPVNGGGVEQYASKLYFGGYQINGENSKRRRIRYYLDITLKAVGLDFLKKKLNYEEPSCTILESMLNAVFIEAGNNGQVARDENLKAKYYLNVLSIEDTRVQFNSLYQNQTYKVVGWYVDALTGRKVDIDLTVDPSDAEKSIIEVA